MNEKDPIELEYARRLPPSSDLPAYKRYSAGQMVLRFALAILLTATIFIVIPRVLMMWFYSGWR